MKPTIVIGHKNPDTDSICSAICYAEFKRLTEDEEYIPCRAGELNGETKYVLEYFGVEVPELIESLEPTLADVQYRQTEGIDQRVSLKKAWEQMSARNIQTLPILTKSGKLRGVVTLGDLAHFYMKDQESTVLAKTRTTFGSIAEALSGEVLAGDAEDSVSKGKVIVASADQDTMADYIEENDLVIIGNRREAQLCAIELKAACMIVCLGAEVSQEIIERARKAGCTVISSPLDTYTCAKLINQAVPVRHLMKKDGIISFHLDDLVADVRTTVSKLRIRYFPILDSDDKYVGLISQRNLLDFDRRRVILVDHNEKGQAVDGIRSADVVEVIDHHRIDAVETTSPIYFRNQPLGCTATIIALMFREKHMEIDPTTAGLLCAAILSDTLMFRSPTCTPTDEAIALSLADIAGIEVEKFAMAMFNAGSHLGRKSPDEIFHLDCKTFHADSTILTVSQVTSVSKPELKKVKEKLLPYMESLLPNSGSDMLFAMLTNIIDESTDLLFVGQGAKGIVQAAFGQECESNSVVLPKVVSRKKQVLGPLISAIEKM